MRTVTVAKNTMTRVMCLMIRMMIFMLMDFVLAMMVATIHDGGGSDDNDLVWQC